MTEVTIAQAQGEVGQSRRSNAKTRVLALSLIAGLTLAACTSETGDSSASTINTAPEASGAAPTSTVIATTNVEITFAPTTTVEITPTATTTADTVPLSTTPSSNPSGDPNLLGCAPYFDITRYENHEYEVCVAYIANAAEIALQGFYKYGNSEIDYLSDGARHHFETRYFDQPREAIEQEVDSWPRVSNIMGNKVEETITLASLSSNLQANRALIQTQESWRVTGSDGEVLYEEPLGIKDITMCRGQLPGHPLHEWFVVSNTQIPDFDCIGFDKANGLTP